MFSCLHLPLWSVSLVSYLLGRNKSFGDGIGNIGLIFVLCLYLTSCSFRVCQAWLEHSMDVLEQNKDEGDRSTGSPTFSPQNPSSVWLSTQRGRLCGDKKMGGWLCPESICSRCLIWIDEHIYFHRGLTSHFALFVRFHMASLVAFHPEFRVVNSVPL